MLINEELKRMEARFKSIQPATDSNFTTLLDPLKAKEKEQPVKKRLCHFDLMVHKKRSEAPFFRGTKMQTWEMTHRGDKWRQDASGMLNYLLSIIVNHYQRHTMMILYDNSLPGERNEREIFKFLHDEVKLNKLCDYGFEITKKLPEWMSVEVK